MCFAGHTVPVTHRLVRNPGGQALDYCHTHWEQEMTRRRDYNRDIPASYRLPIRRWPGNAGSGR
jgi:hypothetical protein